MDAKESLRAKLGGLLQQKKTDPKGTNMPPKTRFSVHVSHVNWRCADKTKTIRKKNRPHATCHRPSILCSSIAPKRRWSRILSI